MIRYLFPFLAAVAQLDGQTPAPAAVLNPASNVLAGLPNYGIAQGSIFVVYGSNLGPSGIATASALPLPNVLGETSVQVTVAGATVDAPMIYALESQVAAVLPSSTPPGSGTVTVNYRNAIGSVPIEVVQANFGISTATETGGGPAVVTFPDYSLVSLVKPAKAGDILTVWGTGLGAIPAGLSDADVPPVKDMDVPLELYVGGLPATILYRGRSSLPGLDQINFVVPPGLSGCYVSIAARTNAAGSNTPTLPVANGQAVCSDANGLPLSTLEGAAGNGSLNLGLINFIGESVNNAASIGIASAVFQKYPAAGLTSSPAPLGQPSIGSCVVSPVAAVNTSGSTTGTSLTGLDAGSNLLLTTPASGAVTVARLVPGSYAADLPSASPGTYTFSNGTGGVDIGAFTAPVSVPAALQWTNQATIEAAGVDRTQALQMTWTGGDAASTVLIQGSSLVARGGIGARFTCAAANAAGQFTIPPWVLASLPAGTNGSVLIGEASSPQAFSAAGLDAGFTVASSATGGEVAYK